MTTTIRFQILAALCIGCLSACDSTVDHDPDLAGEDAGSLDSVGKTAKTLVCHVGNKNQDGGTISLIGVNDPDQHVGNPSHSWEGATDYYPNPLTVAASGVTANQDTDGDLVDEGCERVINSIGLELVSIPAGTFTMGSAETSYPWIFLSHIPPHQVTLTRDFWLGKFEVTQGEYFAVTGSRPSHFVGDDRLPVEQVTWYDAVAFANGLSALEGYEPCYDQNGEVLGGNVYACEGYRLPTEAEWEYAHRAGTTSEFFFDISVDLLEALSAHCWINRYDRTRVVGLKLPNPWGLHDTCGNVFEWINDPAHLYDPTGIPEADPPHGSGPIYASGGEWVIRGGGYSGNSELDGSSAYRFPTVRSTIADGLGFRIARTADVW